jgi:hypothetical protein
MRAGQAEAVGIVGEVRAAEEDEDEAEARAVAGDAARVRVGDTDGAGRGDTPGDALEEPGAFEDARGGEWPWAAPVEVEAGRGDTAEVNTACSVGRGFSVAGCVEGEVSPSPSPMGVSPSEEVDACAPSLEGAPECAFALLEVAANAAAIDGDRRHDGRGDVAGGGEREALRPSRPRSRERDWECEEEEDFLPDLKLN